MKASLRSEGPESSSLTLYCCRRGARFCSNRSPKLQVPEPPPVGADRALCLNSPQIRRKDTALGHGCVSDEALTAQGALELASCTPAQL